MEIGMRVLNPLPINREIAKILKEVSHGKKGFERDC